MIRPATPADVPTLVALVRELADYERAGAAAVLDSDGLRRSLFGPSPAVFAHVAVDDESGEAVGFAVWFLNFSTWLGRHGIYLEDLFIRPTARGRGHGRALLTHLARIAVERGYGRLEWWVLDWNAGAHGFYRALGAEPMDEWTIWRLTGDALESLGTGAPPTLPATVPTPDHNAGQVHSAWRGTV
ncbi:MAG: GNAT family N-acetyltransferase [Mycobacteriales bacterium]